MNRSILSLISALIVAHSSIAQEAKSAILFIGDGMGVAQTTAARIYKGNARDGELTLDTLENVALMRTYSADTMVTDSGAAGTAMATGHKTNTRMIGQTPDGTALQSIIKMAKTQGKSVGIVSNTTITHATPASFYASGPSRYDEASFAEQLIEYGEIDVILGGGREFFIPRESEDPENGGRGARKDKRNLIDEAKAKGYTFIGRSSEMSSAGDGKILGLFSPGMMSYELSRENDKWGEPSLEEMTRFAIERLSKNPKGFLLMVEGGRIDHASHGNRGLHTVVEVIELDEAVKASLDLTHEANDTLIVVTADHETGGMAINGYGEIDLEGTEMFKARVIIGGEHIITYATGPGADPESNGDRAKDDPGYKQPAVVPMSSAAHTGVDVIAYAQGPGSNRFRGTIDNTDIAKNIIATLGLE